MVSCLMGDSTALASAIVRCCLSSLYEVFKASEDVDDRLLWHWFKSPDFQKLIMQLQEGLLPMRHLHNELRIIIYCATFHAFAFWRIFQYF